MIVSDFSGSDKEGPSERGAAYSGGARQKVGIFTADWSRQDRFAAKRSAQGSDGPRSKNANMPDLKIESDQRRADKGKMERKVVRMPDLKIQVDQQKAAERRVAKQGEKEFSAISDGDLTHLSNVVAETLKPMVEQKIRQTVKGMVEDVVKSLNTAQNNWQKENQKTVRDMIATNKTDLLSCTKGLETVIKQMITEGQADLKRDAEQLLEGIESAVSDCDKSWKTVGEQLEKTLKTHGDTIKDAIFEHGDGVKDVVSDLVRKEAETQRHLSNMFSELSELRRKVGDIPDMAWQYQHNGGNNGTMVVQHGGSVEIQAGAVAPAVGNSVAAVVDNAVRTAVTESVISAAGGSVGDINDFLDVPSVPSGNEGEMSVEQVIQNLDDHNVGVDPSLLDEPCDEGSYCY